MGAIRNDRFAGQCTSQVWGSCFILDPATEQETQQLQGCSKYLVRRQLFLPRGGGVYSVE